MKKGYFITFEGADGCGKTTQSELVLEYLRNKGYEVLWTREPGAKGLGQNIRQLLLHYEGDVAPMCEAFLFLADRAQHIANIIKPAVDAGKIVICDRHTDSTIAYQGYGRGENIEQLKYLNNLATGDIRPDLTFVFDVATDVAQTRIGSEKDRMEAAGIEFHKKVRSGYLEIAHQEPQRVKVVNANNSIEKVFDDTKAILDEFLN
ncbi:MAG: dTMP kinase [Clostridium sp.]|nr:dTMP kinase [Clostridium sp.]